MKQIKHIYVNLPVKNINETRHFWNTLGFSFNEQFSDEKALCMVLKEDHIYAMFIEESYFTTFTPRPIFDGKTSQVLLAISLENKEEVDELINKAVTLGGRRYLQAVDEGWMYYDRFADINGHQWEVMSLIS